jgi:hypothetical protein
MSLSTIVAALGQVLAAEAQQSPTPRAQAGVQTIVVTPSRKEQELIHAPADLTAQGQVPRTARFESRGLPARITANAARRHEAIDASEKIRSSFGAG